MNELKIQTCFPREMTMVSNEFLDDYMPRANGEFVKIYLYLLRATARPGSGLTLGAVADHLNCTEADVLRALRYWEKEQVLALAFDASGKELTGIVFLDFNGIGAPCAQKLQAEAKQTPPAAAPSDSETRVTPDRVNELKENEDICELLFIASQYLGKMLSPGEMQKLLYFYDGLHFSTDLIDYLIEYCVSRGHKSIRYIEKVAFSWHDEGITTVRAARASVNNYHKDYFEIFKALGITSHNPIDAEVVLMRKWLEDEHFSMDVIREACTRTVMNTEKPSLTYADGILSRWAAEGVRTVADIRPLDEAHEKKAKNGTGRQEARPNTFNHFEQRTYDYDDLESKLLKGSS